MSDCVYRGEGAPWLVESVLDSRRATVRRGEFLEPVKVTGVTRAQPFGSALTVKCDGRKSIGRKHFELKHYPYCPS
jgi:hypothetical protein